jgi:hypothetical protein
MFFEYPVGCAHISNIILWAALFIALGAVLALGGTLVARAYARYRRYPTL